MNRRQFALTASLSASVLMAATACRSEVAEPVPQARTITDPAGNEVEVPAEVHAVFGMYTTDLDYALALGLEPARTQAIRGGSVGLPYFLPADQIEGLETIVNYPTFEYEKIAAIGPDLILNGLGYEGGPDVNALQAIAPTYTFNGFAGDWREDLTAMGTAFGRGAEAQQFLDRIDARTAEVKAVVDALDEPPTILVGWYDPKDAGFSGPQLDNLSGLVFHDLGIATPALVTDTWTTVSRERIPELSDADVIVLAVETVDDIETELTRAREDTIWHQLPAVAEDRIMGISNELSYASPHAHLEFLNQVEKALALL